MKVLIVKRSFVGVIPVLGAVLVAAAPFQVSVRTAARQDRSPYVHLASIPSIVGGQPLRTFAFDPVSNRFYAGSDRGLFWVDLEEASPRLKGPLVRKDILKIEVAPDLGRVFFFTHDEIGYVDVSAGGSVVTLGGREEAIDMTYELSRHELYVAPRANVIRIYDARSGERAPDVRLPGWYAGMLEAVPGRVFFSLSDKAGLYSIEAGAHGLAPWPVKGRIVTPAYLEADPAGRFLFMAFERDVVAVDIATATVVAHMVKWSPAAIAYDAAATALIVNWYEAAQGARVAVYQVGPEGFVETARLRNPGVGRVGVESITRGFVQNGLNTLLLWSAPRAGGS